MTPDCPDTPNKKIRKIQSFLQSMTQPTVTAIATPEIAKLSATENVIEVELLKPFS